MDFDLHHFHERFQLLSPTLNCTICHICGLRSPLPFKCCANLDLLWILLQSCVSISHSIKLSCNVLYLDFVSHQ